MYDLLHLMSAVQIEPLKVLSSNIDGFDLRLQGSNAEVKDCDVPHLSGKVQSKKLNIVM